MAAVGCEGCEQDKRDYDAAQAEGLDDALRSLAADPYGTAVLLITALGFLAFGAFSFLEARYRQL